LNRPVNWLPPSPGIKNKLVTDEIFRRQHPELQALVDREDRSDYFARLRSLLGKRQQPQPQAQAQPQVTHTTDASDDRESYFAGLRSRLGRKL
jgi:hypothetical protein